MVKGRSITKKYSDQKLDGKTGSALAWGKAATEEMPGFSYRRCLGFGKTAGLTFELPTSCLFGYQQRLLSLSIEEVDFGRIQAQLDIVAHLGPKRWWGENPQRQIPPPQVNQNVPAEWLHYIYFCLYTRILCIVSFMITNNYIFRPYA